MCSTHNSTSVLITAGRLPCTPIFCIGMCALVQPNLHTIYTKSGPECHKIGAISCPGKHGYIHAHPYPLANLNTWMLILIPAGRHAGTCPPVHIDSPHQRALLPNTLNTSKIKRWMLQKAQRLKTLLSIHTCIYRQCINVCKRVEVYWNYIFTT